MTVFKVSITTPKNNTDLWAAQIQDPNGHGANDKQAK